MHELDLHYPPDACPFCAIAAAYPARAPALWAGASREAWAQSVPEGEEVRPEKTAPASFVVLASRDVVAFLDILPMTGGELTVRSGATARSRERNRTGADGACG